MQKLYIIRHGIAGKRIEDDTKDELRPLTKKGKEKTKSIAKGLKDFEISFDLVLTSPLLRAKETAEIVHAYCGLSKKIVITDLLKPEASLQKLAKFLNQIKKHKKIAIVGHEPHLSTFASYCLSNSKESFIDLKKGGVLMLEIDENIKPGNCVLSWLMEPNQIIG